jgi:cold-inducible RNA-binding protein
MLSKRREMAMAKKLFVGGLSWNTTESGLREAFERFGELDEVTIITDRETGRSRGFGFVTFIEDGAATRAVEELDGTELDGRRITVNEARSKGGRGDKRGGGGRRRDDDDDM